MGKARDEAGNIWETDAQGNPVRMLQPGQRQPGVIPLGSPDPMKPGQLVGQDLNNRRAQEDLRDVPVDRYGKTLGNERTAQGITLERGNAISGLVKQFGDEDAVAAYRQILPNVAKALSSPDSAAGDLNIVYAYVKSNDPIGAVRGEDTEAAKRTAALVDQWKAKLGMLKDGDRMPPTARKEMIEALRSTATQFEKGYAEARERYSAIAKESGLPAEVIIGPHEGGKYNDLERSYVSNIAKGGTQTNLDPQGTASLDALIKQGAPFDVANKWVREQGGSPLNPQMYQKAVRYAKANPGYSGSLAEFTRTTETSPAQQVLGNLVGPADIGYVKGFKKAWDRGAQGLEGAFNAIPFVPNSNSAAAASQQSDQFFADKTSDPNAETFGRLSGATLFAAPLKGAMTAGAAGNLMMTDSTGWDAAGDAAIGAGGGWLGDKAIRGLAGLVAPQGRDAMGRLAQEGVQFSPGQMIGGTARNIEDRLTANPVLGPKIDAIREEGLNAANRIPANRALAPIGGRLPDDIPAGHEAVAYTKRQLGSAYDNALAGQNIGLDPTYITRLNALGQRANMRPQELNQLGEIVQREVGGAFQSGPQLGQMSGNTYKKLDSRLGQLSGDLGRSPDAFARDIADGLRQVKDQTRALARRQNPQMGDALRNADEGYANYKILERAAASNPATGIFTPGQLRTAVKAGDRSVGKGATARGAARMQDLSSDLSEALPSGVGSSGTSEREQVNKLAPWIMGSLMSPLYSQPAQKALEKLLLRQPGPDAKNIAKLMRSLPRGMFGGGAPLLIESGFSN